MCKQIYFQVSVNFLLGTNRRDHIIGKQDQIMLFDGGVEEYSHCVCPTSLFPEILWE